MWIDRNAPTQPLAALALLLLAWLAPFLGGSTEPWAQGIICLLMAGVIVFFPPLLSPPRRLGICFLLLLVLGLTAFLPAAWLGSCPWRRAIVQDMGISLPPTLSPQPWLSAECWFLLLAGVAWTLYAASQNLTSDMRLTLARWYVAGVVVLAVWAMLAVWLGQRMSFWHPRENFGFFPNRNQMGNWLAIAGVLIPALIFEDWERRRWLAIGWVLALAAIGLALVMTYSRAGILIYFGGTALFLGLLSGLRRWTARLALSLAAMIIMLTLFLIFGGATLKRLQATTWEAKDQPLPRWLIQRDAVTMVNQSPVFGTGLGNFSPIFALYRNHSRNEARALHPESDWLWLAGETGWGGVAVCGAGLVLLLAGAWPLERGTSRTLRLAAGVGVIAFAVHGTMDVSGHRLGSFLPICFFILLMGHPRHLRNGKTAEIRAWRVVGLLIGMAGAYWLIGSLYGPGAPVREIVARAKDRADAALRQRNFAEALQITNAALPWSPLDWELYFRRATAELSTDSGQARQDFLKARMLEPNSSRLPYSEGHLWMQAGRPAAAVAAWREALRRNQHNPAEYYTEMLNISRRLPKAHRGMEELGVDRPDFFLVLAQNASPETFRAARERVLAQDPALESYRLDQKRKFFHFWAEREGIEPVVAAVEKHPAWKEAAWPQLAAALAKEGNYEGAYRLAHSMMEPPVLPRLTAQESLEELERRAILHPDDFATAYLLLRGRLDASQFGEALALARRVRRQQACPPYFEYLHAEAAAAIGEWLEAWGALQASQEK